MAKKKFTPLTAAVGAAFLASATLAPLASAADNPFASQDLNSGYKLAAKDAEGKCGGEKAAEGKCGEKTDAEGKCGEGKAEGAESKGKEGKCGEGKCGEGKCGGEA